MGGIIGRLFREFAITLSAAILVSMVISLTTTPMMCAIVLKSEKEIKHGKLYRWSERMLRRCPLRIQANPELDSRPPCPDSSDLCGNSCPQRLSHHHHSHRLLPSAGYRRHDRRHARPAGHLLLCHAKGSPAGHQHHQGRPRRAERDVLHRRPGRHQRRLHLRRAENPRLERHLHQS